MNSDSNKSVSVLAVWGARLGTSLQANGRGLERDLLLSINDKKYFFRRASAYSPELVADSFVPSKSTVAIWLSERGFTELQDGKSSPQLLYRTGELKVEGDMEQALLVFYVLDL